MSAGAAVLASPSVFVSEYNASASVLSSCRSPRSAIQMSINDPMPDDVVKFRENLVHRPGTEFDGITPLGEPSGHVDKAELRHQCFQIDQRLADECVVVPVVHGNTARSGSLTRRGCCWLPIRVWYRKPAHCPVAPVKAVRVPAERSRSLCARKMEFARAFTGRHSPSLRPGRTSARERPAAHEWAALVGDLAAWRMSRRRRAAGRAPFPPAEPMTDGRYIFLLLVFAAVGSCLRSRAPCRS